MRQFQSAQQRALRIAASQRLPNWECFFSPQLRPVRDVHSRDIQKIKVQCDASIVLLFVRG